MKPTIARLHELFELQPDTGFLIRRIARGRSPAGARAGGASKDRRQVQIDGQNLGEHVVVFAMLHGEWPSEIVDHRNGIASDNAGTNLRPATVQINQQNRRRAAKHNKCGVLGVVLGSNGRYSARIRVDGRQRHLGCFATKEAAHEVYVAAKRTHHEGCTL